MPCLEVAYRPLLAAGLSLLLMPFCSPGQTPEASAFILKPLSLTATTVPGEHVGIEQVFRERVCSGTNEFLFVLPLETRVTFNGTDQIQLLARNGRFFATLRILALSGENTNAFQLPKNQQDYVMAEHPDACNLEVFPIGAAGREGLCFQFQEKRPPAGTRFLKIELIPCAAGILELTLSADVAETRTASQVFQCFEQSLLSNEQGPIRIVPRLGQS
jgi:hypothetical protein